MSRRRRGAPPRLALMSPDPDLLALLGNAVDPVDRVTHADIVLWTPLAARAAPMPVGSALNVLDLRHVRPGAEALPTAAGLLLAGSETAAGAWAARLPGLPIAVVPTPLTPAATPAADVQILHIRLADRACLALAQQAAAWARARRIACGVTTPEGPQGLALAAGFDPAPVPAPGTLLLDLFDDPLADTRLALDTLAAGGPVLFRTETPFFARLEQAGAARRVTDAAQLDDLRPDDLRAMSAAALAYVAAHHDAAAIATALRRTLLAALADWRDRLTHWPDRGPNSHVLVISDEALNLIDIRVHRPFAALLRRGAITGYSLLRHGDFVFSTTEITPDLRFGAIWVQRSTDPLVQLLLRRLDKPFIYDLDDLLCVSPAYRDPFPPEATDIVRALADGCTSLSCATTRLAQSLGRPAKSIVTPNLADAEPGRNSGQARTVVWASSDKPALTASRTEIERAVRDFCLAYRLKLLCIGAEPPASFADLDLEHVALVSYDAYLARLRDAAPGILLGPLDTGADPDTQAFIDAKSDIKLIEARTAGLVPVFSRAAPYLDSDLDPPILCDNDYRSWLDGLERARAACQRPTPPTAWPSHRDADALGPLPWAEALRRAPTDLAAADVTAALHYVRTQAETLLTTPDLFDEQDYLRRHTDVRDAVAQGTMPSGYRHYLQAGFREGRSARRLPTPHDAGQFWWTRLLQTVDRLETTITARDAQIDQLRDRIALRRTPTQAPTPPPPPTSHPWHPDAEIPGPCPVCDAPGPHSALLVILDHTLGRCQKCGACFYPDRVPYLYENEAEAALLLQLYLEQNAGIHQQTGLLFALEHVDSVLDIGCGFGFTVDLAASVLGWHAVGIDPSAMAAAGAELLGADIRNTYLGDDPAERFGLVIASEVIEHLPDPHPFLARLRTALAPGGSLILTTPDAGALEPGIGPARTLCITAPRVHLVLFTRDALALALQRAGFRHIQVTASNDSLVAIASDRDLKLRADPGPPHLVAYQAYLARVLDRATTGTPLWNGAAGRLFALLAPTADLAELHALFARIADAWRARFAIDLPRLRLPPILSEADRLATSAATLAATQPLNLPGVLLNRATLEWRTPGRTPEQVLVFARAAYLHALQTGRILQAANMIDHDLRQTAIRARMLILDCLAELAPEVEIELLQALAEPSPGASAEWLDPDPDALVARLAPAFTDAVRADRFDAAARLEPWLHDFDQLGRSLAHQPDILLRALFTIGVRRLIADHDPAAALAAFQRMATEARRLAPAHDFLRIAKEHIELATQRLHQP